MILNFVIMNVYNGDIVMQWWQGLTLISPLFSWEEFKNLFFSGHGFAWYLRFLHNMTEHFTGIDDAPPASGKRVLTRIEI